MNMMLALLPLLAAPGLSQDEVWKSLKLGDRVQVVFRSGNMITGQLTAKPGDPRVKVAAVDYAVAPELTLDVTLEYPGLNGTLTVPRKEIKEVRKLQNLDAQTMKRMQDELQKVQEAARVDEEERKRIEKERDARKPKAGDPADPAVPATPDGKEPAPDADRLKKGLELLARFPPPEWGPHRVQELAAKALRKQPITLTEKEFADNIGAWQEALAYQQAQKKAEKAPEKK